MNLLTLLVLVALPAVFALWMRMESADFERRPVAARTAEAARPSRKV